MSRVRGPGTRLSTPASGSGRTTGRFVDGFGFAGVPGRAAGVELAGLDTAGLDTAGLDTVGLESAGFEPVGAGAPVATAGAPWSGVISVRGGFWVPGWVAPGRATPGWAAPGRAAPAEDGAPRTGVRRRGAARTAPGVRSPPELVMRGCRARAPRVTVGLGAGAGATSSGPWVGSGEYGAVTKVDISTPARPTVSRIAVAPVASRQSAPTPRSCARRRIRRGRLAGRRTPHPLKNHPRTPTGRSAGQDALAGTHGPWKVLRTSTPTRSDTSSVRMNFHRSRRRSPARTCVPEHQFPSRSAMLEVRSDSQEAGGTGTPPSCRWSPACHR
jgi:hypothetical protein